MCELTIELKRTWADGCGQDLPRSLQRRLRGAVRRPGGVRFSSTPASSGRNDSQMTAKTTNGFLDRLRPGFRARVLCLWLEVPLRIVHRSAGIAPHTLVRDGRWTISPRGRIGPCRLRARYSHVVD